jgi:methylenetetrahydrofolate dehydrogenase (NADP+)/methenyltetrahydrofolate cyclohydrolase
MSGKVISGTELAETIREELKQEITALKEQGTVPGLATVLVGEDPASRVYVRSKNRACKRLGMHSEQFNLPEEASQEEVESLVGRLNGDPTFDGILVQLPLPRHLDEERILEAISLEKDVDGFHPINIGRLAMKGREPLFIPCTPNGVIALIDYAGTPIEGARAVILGRSNIVGLPVSFLLLHRNATVTICHSRTQDLADVIQQADILVAAIGQPHFVKADMVKEGVTVIDVGINRLEDGTLVGDVDFEAVVEKAAAITPVPRGVGPMTITMLLKNTVESAKRRAG